MIALKVHVTLYGYTLPTHMQLLGHLLQVAKQVAGKEELEDGYRIGMYAVLLLTSFPGLPLFPRLPIIMRRI